MCHVTVCEPATFTTNHPPRMLLCFGALGGIRTHVPIMGTGLQPACFSHLHTSALAPHKRFELPSEGLEHPSIIHYANAAHVWRKEGGVEPPRACGLVAFQERFRHLSDCPSTLIVLVRR